MPGYWIRKYFELTSRPLTSSRKKPHKAFPLAMEELEARSVPASSISIANASFAEGDSGSSLLKFNITRIGDLDSELNVSYETADGTAVAGVDYTAVSDKVVIPAGADSATIAVPVVGNLSVQDNRTFTVQLTDVAPSAKLDRQLGTVPTGTTPFAIAVGDLNGDGKLDLAIANSGSSNVSVILNTTVADGAPTFGLPQTYQVDQTPRGIAIGDVNGDGKPDLAVANFSANSVSVLLNKTAVNSDSTSFASQQTFATGPRGTDATFTPTSVALVDINDDGKLDLAIANQSAASIAVLLNTTDKAASVPTFAEQQTFATRSGPNSVTFGDVNGDGKVDLAVADLTASCVSVILNTTPKGAGSASFSGQKTFATGGLPMSLAMGDLNGDGKLDLAVANGATGNLSILMNNTGADGSLDFQEQKTFATGGSARTVVIGDVNGDSKPDLAVTAQSMGNVAVLMNTTSTTSATPFFSSPQTFTSGSQPFAAAVADVNSDGKSDVIITNRDLNCVSVMLNDTKLTATTPAITVVNATATGTILDDDAPAKLQLSATSAWTTPGGAFNLPMVTVKNAAGAALPKVKVVFRVVANGGAAASFPGNANTATVISTDDGVAAPPTLTANNTGGNYALTIDAQDAAGSTSVTASVPLANAVATTTTLKATPDASTGGDLVSFTATVAPSPGLLGSVKFLDNGVPLTGATNVSLVFGIATCQVSLLAPGTHAITAVYSGASGFATSTSTPLNFEVAPLAGAPKVVSVVTNGNIASLAGAQHSRIVSLAVTFDKPVQLDPNAMSLALHTNNVIYAGAVQPNGYGALPTSLEFASTDDTTWIITFVGNTENGGDGFNSLKDGVYDLKIDGAKVHARDNANALMAGVSTTTFHRLFGDTGAATTPADGASGVDFQAAVNAGDNLAFRTSFNNPTNYKAFLDYNGDGLIGSGDNFQFRSRFNKPLVWRV